MKAFWLLTVPVLLGCTSTAKPAMETCTVCGELISIEVESCPNCGKRQPTATQMIRKQSELSKQVLEARARIMHMESAQKEHGEGASREMLEKFGNDLDPWGNPYQYEKTTRRFWSYGPDRFPNTNDDIGIRKLTDRPAGAPFHSH